MCPTRMMITKLWELFSPVWPRRRATTRAKRESGDLQPEAFQYQRCGCIGCCGYALGRLVEMLEEAIEDVGDSEQMPRELRSLSKSDLVAVGYCYCLRCDSSRLDSSHPYSKSRMDFHYVLGVQSGRRRRGRCSRDYVQKNFRATSVDVMTLLGIGFIYVL